ncbi:MAG: hypothetical protein M1825_000350 [Sarcosagium campestre]|nr:MAG: hypothetical protein M1825_000350 [Sarcosagium campestre]
MPAVQPRRRFVLLLVAVSFFVSFTFVYHFRSQPIGVRTPHREPVTSHEIDISADTLHGDVIAPKLGNETLKAELGRAAWKLFHTTMARFPDKPKPDESNALQSYIHLFARLYPCGECAGHFRQILSRFPPQVKSRSTAAAWACHVHNEVNKSLKKDLFDCSKIGDFYDCGCAEEDEDKDEADKATTDKIDGAKIVADGGRFDSDLLKVPKPLELEKEGEMRGG